MSRYEVIVGNIGTVYDGNSKRDAERKYEFYVKDSMTGLGRSGDEDVVMFCDSEPCREHFGALGIVNGMREDGQSKTDARRSAHKMRSETLQDRALKARVLHLIDTYEGW